MASKFSRLVVFVASVELTMCGVFADDRAEEVIMSASLAPTRVHSIEYAASSGLSRGAIPKKTPQSLTFHGAGDKYRVESVSRAVAFNGSRYQYWLKGPNLHSYSSEPPDVANPTPFLDPLLRSYRWLFPSSAVIDWRGLKNPEYWKKIASDARFVGKGQVNGHKVIDVEVDRINSVGEKYTFVVSFAEDLDYLPIQWFSYFDDRVLSAHFEVTEIKRITTNGETFVIPLQSSLSTTGAEANSHSLRGIQKIDPDTLTINGAIDHSIFTLDTTHATDVLDIDAKKREASDSGDTSKSSSVSMPSLVWLDTLSIIAEGHCWLAQQCGHRLRFTGNRFSCSVRVSVALTMPA